MGEIKKKRAIEESAKQKKYYSSYSIVGLMPFVETSFTKIINMGPVIFWAGDQLEYFVERNDTAKAEECLKWFGTFRTYQNNQGQQIITTEMQPSEMTVISIKTSIIKQSSDKVNELINDAIRLLFFANYSDDLIRGDGIDYFNPFRHVLGLDINYIRNGHPWTKQYNYETSNERGTSIRHIDHELLYALSRLLNNKYSKKSTDDVRRIIKAIYYYSERFYSKDRGPIISMANSPEDFVFLATSYEVLFHINEPRNKRSELTKRIIGLLQIKDDIPKEYMRKWVEGFYELRSEIVHGREITSSVFSSNPNLRVHYVKVGYQIFPICIDKKLQEKRYLNKSKHALRSFVYNKKVMSFLWPQEKLLKNILKELIAVSKTRKDEVFFKCFRRMQDLVHLYIDIYGREEFGSGGHEDIEIKIVPYKHVEKTVKSIRHFMGIKKKFDRKNQEIKHHWLAKSGISANEKLMYLLQKQYPE